MIRLRSIELSNFKNVAHGRIEFGDTQFGSSIMGIYGQNGSGKTAVIDALGCIRNLMRGLPLASGSVDLIGVDGTSAGVDVELEITADSSKSLGLAEGLSRNVAGGNTFFVGYSVAFDASDGSPRLISESLSVRAQGLTKRGLLSYSLGESGTTPLILPEGRWRSLRSLAGREASVDLAVAQRSDSLRASSKIFSKELESFAVGARDAYSRRLEAGKLYESEREAFEQTLSPLMDSVTLLKQFALLKLEVFGTTRGAALAFNTFSLSAPSSGRGDWARVGSADTVYRGYLRDVTLSADATTLMPLDVFNALSSAVEVENRVLETIVPGLNVRINALHEETLDDGTRGVRVEVLSCRGDAVVPFRAESEGIKKIVSMLGRIIDVYNDESACLAIDEVDSGVFEFLLGEILQVILEHGRGQLIFTAHNLRPLECLPPACLVFTTVNPENRYIRFRGSAKTNNMRNQYLRAINLGGQQEQVYEPTNGFDMNEAFFIAGHPEAADFDELVERVRAIHG